MVWPKLEQPRQEKRKMHNLVAMTSREAQVVRDHQMAFPLQTKTNFFRMKGFHGARAEPKVKKGDGGGECGGGGGGGG